MSLGGLGGSNVRVVLVSGIVPGVSSARFEGALGGRVLPRGMFRCLGSEKLCKLWEVY